jgi:uncharacterized protein YdcH (DUF465 family)
MKFLFILFFIVLSTTLVSVHGQGNLIDANIQYVIDSLDVRIGHLNRDIKSYGANRDARFFHSKRELNMTVFVREYEELVYNEDLITAQRLIDSRIMQAKKRSDSYAVNYYSEYQTKLTRLRGQKRAHYQKLFAKEKTFRKEYNTYIEPADEMAYRRAQRMLSLAIKYAEEKDLKDVLKFLYRYEKHTIALILEINSEYELSKLTASEAHFQKALEELLEQDSLKYIKEGQRMVALCFDYASNTRTKLDVNYFGMQKIVVANALADWNEKQGLSSQLASLTGQSVVARRDSINKEGIYHWNDFILVIGSLNFNSKTESIRKGEAIIDADRTLHSYMQINKLAKRGRKVELGKTYLLPVKDNDKVSYFRYDGSKQAWQYIVAYSRVVSPKFTREIGRFLPPLQFQDSIEEIIQSNRVSSQ